MPFSAASSVEIKQEQLDAVTPQFGATAKTGKWSREERGELMPLAETHRHETTNTRGVRMVKYDWKTLGVLLNRGRTDCRSEHQYLRERLQRRAERERLRLKREQRKCKVV